MRRRHEEEEEAPPGAQGDGLNAQPDAAPPPLRLRNMITAAEQQSEDMIEQIRKIIRMENEIQHDREKQARGGRSPLAPGSWAPPALKDVCVCVFGMGAIGSLLVDMLVRSGCEIC